MVNYKANDWFGSSTYIIIVSLQVSACVCMYIYIIYIIYPVILEYRIEILASQGIPIIELENSYLEYSWRHIEYRWAI